MAGHTKKLSKLVSTAFLGTASTALLAAPAGATATSGAKFQEQIVLNNGATINACMESVIADVADFRAYAYSKQPASGCSGGGLTVPAGYLGAYLNGYRSGSFCGQISPRYSSTATDYYGVGGAICSNPSGSQSFHTSGYAFFYKGPSYQHNDGYKLYGLTSPIQNY